MMQPAVTTAIDTRLFIKRFSPQKINGNCKSLNVTNMMTVNVTVKTADFVGK